MKPLLILMLLLLAPQVWAADITCDVVPSGTTGNTPTNPYNTWATAANLPSTCYAVAAANTPVSGHKIYVAPGIYADHLLLADTDLSNSVWQAVNNNACVGSACDAVSNRAAKGQVTVAYSGSAYSALRVSAGLTGVTFNDFALTSNAPANHAVYWYGSTGIMNRTYIHDAAYYFLYGDSTANVTVNNFLFEGLTNSIGVATTSSASVTLNNGIIRDSLTTPLAGLGLSQGSTGTLTANNVEIYGSTSGIASARVTAGTLTINNSVIDSTITKDLPTISKTGGTLNLTNNTIAPNWYYTHKIFVGTPDVDTGNRYDGNVGVKHRQREGVISLSIDNDVNYAYDTVAPVLRAKGARATLYPYFRYFNDWIVKAQSLYTEGIYDLNPHQWSYTSIDYTHAYTVSQTGGTNCTIAFDAANKVFTGNCDSATYDFAYNATCPLTTYEVSGSSSSGCYDGVKQLGTVLSDINANGKGWTFAYSASGGQTANRVTAGTRISSLAGKTATAVPTDIDFLIDPTGATGFYFDEITNLRNYVFPHFFPGWNPTNRMMSTGYGAYGVNASRAMKAAGFGGNRISNANTTTGWLMSSFNTFKMPFFEALNGSTGILTDLKVATGMANNGAGLIRVTRAAHGYSTGDNISLYGTVGTTEANGDWVVTRIDADNYDLQGSTFTHAWSSGGTMASDSELQQRVRSFCHMVATVGGYGNFLMHDATQMTGHQWGILIDTIREFPDVRLMTEDEALHYIQSQGTRGADCDDGGATATCTYTRTWADQSNYRPLPSSAAIGAGIDLCSTLVSSTDAAGKQVCSGGVYVGRGLPEIGAYEFYPRQNHGLFGFGW